jgi:hypothetical protein
MPFDFKKEYRDLYLPTAAPAIVDVPEMTFFAVDGEGDPNTSEEYKNALEVLYGLSYAVKMSKKGDVQPEGYFDFVVPPLEGLWQGDIGDKSGFRWTAMIRQPDFVTESVFERAKETLAKKKPRLDLSAARLERFAEGLCAQLMHLGPYDDEPASVVRLTKFVAENGYVSDVSARRRHHEIYLADPRKTAPDKLKTVLRQPIK